MKQKIRTIRTTNFDVMRDFYTTTLGLTARDPKEYGHIEFGFSEANFDAEIHIDRVCNEEDAGCDGVMQFFTYDVALIAEGLKNRNAIVTIRQKLKSDDLEAVIVDPDGHSIQLTAKPQK